MGVGATALVANPAAILGAYAQGRLRRARVRTSPRGYGDPVPAGEELALPRGFQYRVISREDQIMSDGQPTPGAHDGMAAFPLPNGNIRLIRNHEDRNRPNRARPLGPTARSYDHRGGGGTTSLEVEPDGERRVVRDFVSLSGTIVNCAGGPTPWGTWITCEETVEGRSDGWAQPHGYCFEVPILAEDTVSRPPPSAGVHPPLTVGVPLPAMGRFVHEAVAVDPVTGLIYLTEDRQGAGLYRFIPHKAGDLIQGGRLQMMCVRGLPRYNTAVNQTVGRPLPVDWVTIPNPDPEAAEADDGIVYQQGRNRGAARFRRLEGCWFGADSLFFNATNGGNSQRGQVWQLTPGRGGSMGDTLRLVYESTDPDLLDGPDNLTVSPRGGLLICEDGQGVQYLRGLTARGELFDFGINLLNNREFAGATFAPDGRTLFVNIQGDTRAGGSGDPSLTFAIWGPWGNGPL